MEQNIPHKPEYWTDLEWEFVQARDRRQCALAAECRSNGRPGFCDQNLDIDHQHARHLGGDDSVANARFLCACVNRGRPLEPDPKWMESNFWDRDIDVRVLRAIQCIAGHDALNELKDKISDFERTLSEKGTPNNLRRLLLGGRITLLPGATGIGKTLLMQSVWHTLNKIIGIGRPRVRSPLWFSPDTTIRDMTAAELETEAYDFKLVGKRPKVNIASSFSDLMRGPMGADITVACPQVAWKKDGSNRTDLERLAALVPFDTVVWDEGDWATDQVRYIADLMRHAMQFALTASPPLGGEQPKQLQAFLRRCVMISHDAIADYTRARDLDGCLKHVAPIISAAEHDAHEFILAGRDNEAAQPMPPDHPLYLSAILQAVKEADNEETNMRALVGEDYFSPHIQVAMSTIPDIKTMKPNLQQNLERLYAHGHLHNLGWNVSAIYGGHERDKETLPEEKDLSGKTKTGAWRHPFLLAKNNKGQATKDSRRILLMCQIGDRALNNWPISKFVDCTTSESFTELIQRDRGRPARWPARLAHWLGNPDLRDYATMKIYFPSSLCTPDKIKAMEEANAFVDDMQNRMANAGFATWWDLMDGHAPEDVASTVNPAELPLTAPEKYQIQATLADVYAARGVVDVEVDIAPAVTTLFPLFTPKQIEKAINYGTRLIDSSSFRDRETRVSGLINRFKLDPVSVMLKLKPQEKYAIGALVRFVKGESAYNGMVPAYVDRLEQTPPDPVTVHGVSDKLRSLQKETYQEPARTRRLIGSDKEPGALREIANELAYDLYRANQAPRDKGLVPRAIYRAAAMMFDIAKAEEGGDMDHPAYHIAILGRYRRDLQAVARGLLISDGSLGPALARLASMGDQT